MGEESFLRSDEQVQRKKIENEIIQDMKRNWKDLLHQQKYGISQAKQNLEDRVSEKMSQDRVSIEKDAKFYQTMHHDGYRSINKSTGKLHEEQEVVEDEKQVLRVSFQKGEDFVTMPGSRGGSNESL